MIIRYTINIIYDYTAVIMLNLKKLTTSLVGAAVLAGLSATAAASDYYVVIPVKNKTTTATAPVQPQISVTLSAVTLAAAERLTAYSYDFNQALTVTGDADYSAGSVAWSVDSGVLPDGLALSAVGVLSGTLTSINEYNFTLRALYKSVASVQSYALTVYPPTQLTLGLPVNFGTVTLDATSSKSITVTNPGTSTITQVYLAQQPSAAGLTVTANTCGTLAAPVSLPPNGACTVALSWTPVDAGSLAGKEFVFNSSTNTLNASLSGVAEPASNLVTAMLRYDGAPFTDDTGNSVASVGTAPTLATNSAVGSGSANFAAVGGHTLPMSASNFVSSDFTVEAFVKPAVFAGTIFSRDTNTNVNYGNATFGLNGNGTLNAFCNPNANSSSGRLAITTTGALNLGVWNHVAWTRKGTAWSIFINGKKLGTGTGSCTFRSTDITRIGHTLYSSTPSVYLNGLMDNVRITTGRSLYNADFVPAAQ